MEILTAIVGAVADYTVGPIIRQGGYIIHCKRNIRTLQTRVEDLKAARGRVDVEIDEADRKGEHIYPDVKQWITKVEEIAGKADELLKDEHQAKMNCMHGFCPNLLTRQQLSRKSTKLVEVVLEFQGKVVNFPSISYGGRTEVVFLTSTKDYEAFDSRILTLNGIMDELKNPDINKIGVYGIAGVGKTTLAEEVVRQVIKDESFDDVVIVRDVKEYPDIERIQKEIAEQLGMDVFKDQSRTAMAGRIYDRLKNKKTFLVLDDIWNFFDLKVVGLPDVATCKILFTSRSGEVLCTQMGTQKEFQLAALEEQECWSLFESKLGDVVRDPKILTVATQVAKKCGGLPILVVTIASALKKGTLPEWEDALRRLETFQNTGSIKQAFLALEWIYDKLDDEELQSLFLLSGVTTWENSIFLDDLLKLAVGLDLLKGVNTMKEARNSLLSLVKKLKNFCLLLDDNGDTSVRMHDLVNDVAKEIASRDQQLLSVACGAELKNWPKTSKCGKISIKSDSLAKLSEVLECQKLEMFHLHCEDEQPLQVPNGLFANMEKLKVLSLMNVKNLASLGFLKNLQALCLDRCEMEDIAVVGELRKLEILSLGYTNMKQLPKEIGELTCLRLLDLTRCYSLQVIAPNVLSRLTRLEDLRMRNSSIKWEAEQEGERSNASLSELKHLSLLTALEINIPNPGMLPKDLFSDKLERFHICIGDHSWEGWGINTLRLQFTTGDELDQGLKMLVKGSEYLTLQGGANVNETAFGLEGDNFRQLKHLQLRKLDTTYIINSKFVFSSLTTLEVTDCDGIKFLFSSSMARSLIQLKTLTISRCRSMVVIVSTQEDDEENNIVNMFYRLEFLTLRELPSLVGFCSGSYVGFSSLEEALISNGQSKSTTITKEIEDGDSKDHLGVDNDVRYFLFDEKVTFPSLERLRLEELPKLEAVWHNQLAPDSFCRIIKVRVDSCPSLIKLFVPCIMERLDALKTLRVWSCPLLEVVFKCGRLKFKETHDPSTKELKTFNCCPNLEKFSIQCSDGLKYIFQTEDRLEIVPKFVFPKVTKLLLLNLPQFKSIYPGTHVSQWPSLQELNVDKCGEVEIIAGELSVYQEKQESPSHSNPIGKPLILVEKVVFSSLTTLNVAGCHGVKFLFSPSMARSLVQLRTVTISRCRSMVVIVSTQEDDEENNIVNMFSKLESLTLRELPSLVGFCSGSYVRFSSLEEALISNGQSKSTTITKEIEDGDSKDHLGVDNAVRYFLFDEKVTFPSLERLRLEELPKLEAVWHNQLAPDSFCRIIKVRVDSCPSLIKLFVPCIMERLDALKTLRVWSCPLLEVVFKCGRLKFKETHDPSTKELKTFNCCPNLEKFSIQRSDGLKYIFQKEERLETVPKFVFPKVTKLLLLNLPQFKSIYPGTHVSQWPSLQELNVEECSEVEIIAGELSVYQEKQESPSHSNPIGQPLILVEKVVFSSLTTLNVAGCHGVKFLFSPSMARSLVQLRTVTISRCRSMVVIVSTQEDDEENNIVNMFSKLESLTLRELPSLVGFCSGSYVRFSSLEEALISNGQSKSTTITKEIEDGDSKDHLGVDNAVRYFLFDEKVTFPSLERLRLEELPKLEAVWHNQLAPDSFCRIIKVRVDSCPSLIKLFVPCIMERLDALKTLRVWSCPLLEVVFKCGRLKFKETHDPSTKELKTFNCCPNLEKFSIQRSDGLKYIFQKEERLETVPKFVFPKVTKLLLLNLPQFKSIYPGTHVSQWPSLQELNVEECGEVEIIAGELSVYQEKQESPSHSNPIGQPLILVEKVVFSSLTTLNVAGCHGVKFLFSPSMARSLVQLRTVTISRCRSMVVIVSTQEDDEENNIVNMFSKLESLTLRELPSLVGFCSGSYAGFSSLEETLISNGQSKSTTITKEIEDGDSKDHLGVDNAVRYFLFDEKVTFPSLERLWLDELPKLEAVWQNQLAPDSFCRIREVIVDSCPSLINLCVPFITERLDALKTLMVWSCPSLEVVFKCGALKFKETHDPSTKELKTFNCCPNLEYFSIERSDGLKYIFQKEERLETVPKFVFPKVTKLLLCNLPQFKSIYPGTHVSQWPSLQELNVEECGEVKIIAGEFSVYQEKQESASHSNPIEQPLILIEKGSSLFPSLETLTLGAIEMWSGPPPAQFCSKVKLVVVRGATFSKHATFLQRLHNLEKIIVEDMGDTDPCRETFVDAGNSGGEIQVRKLTIRFMDKLMQIGKVSSQSAVPVFPKLEKLRVWWCSRLKNLDSSTISFQNLTSLTVGSLDGLKYLVSHRIARSLMQLTRLKIRDCKRMEVIVATEEDDDELAFSRLKHLELRHVPHLRGLCSGNCILKFPSLETLSISRRLKLKLFSHDEMRCIIDYKIDTDVEDAPANDDYGGDDNEVNDDGDGNDKKDDDDSACDA